jgi:Family of unknown function (DUF6314)
MLAALFGNKNIERILTFLFVNEKCYGTQLKRQLNISLTPVQKALLRLEKGGIILSFYEGKTRVYKFNPGFPLIDEIEKILKKNYTMMSSHDKKDYYVVNINEIPSAFNTKNKTQTLLHFWNRLSLVNKLTFNASSKSQYDSGWNGKGYGEVLVTKQNFSTLIFHERGFWKGKNEKDVNFSNVFRWTLDKIIGVISLEHLRRGVDNPVFLFHLAPSTEIVLSSIDSHLCDGDSYFGRVHFEKNSLRLNWRVIGPKKNEEIDYYYF